jgi:hypothetical protein
MEAAEMDGYPKSVKEAREQDAKHYFTGKPCPVGHVALRWTSTMGCVECRERHNAKFLSTEAGKASLQKSQQRYYYANKQARKENLQRWRQNNPERAKWHAGATKRLRKRATTAYGQKGVKELYALARKLGLTVDHIVPLNHPRVCGLHNIFNLQLLSLEENIKKRNHFEDEL